MMKRTFLLAFSLVLAACAGPSATTTDPEPPPPTYQFSEFETFDPTAYRDVPPPATGPVEHEVPEELLDGTVERAAASRTAQGFRIQVFSSQSKAEADAAVDDAIAWWTAQQESGELSETYSGAVEPPPVYLAFRQPYYRVRLGNFATRGDADRFLRVVSSRFPTAFVLPDEVTLRQ